MTPNEQEKQARNGLLRIYKEKRGKFFDEGICALGLLCLALSSGEFLYNNYDNQDTPKRRIYFNAVSAVFGAAFGIKYSMNTARNFREARTARKELSDWDSWGV